MAVYHTQYFATRLYWSTVTLSIRMPFLTKPQSFGESRTRDESLKAYNNFCESRSKIILKLKDPWYEEPNSKVYGDLALLGDRAQGYSQWYHPNATTMVAIKLV